VSVEAITNTSGSVSTSSASVTGAFAATTRRSSMESPQSPGPRRARTAVRRSPPTSLKPRKASRPWRSRPRPRQPC
jgi:hypothetical protein